MSALHRLSAATLLIALGVLLSFTIAACGAPAGARRTDDDSESSGDEDDGEDEDDYEDDLAITGGRWAPRASIARVEDIPRAGLVEERPSRTGAVRVIALLPVDGTGNHIIELIGLPALARDQVVASLRAAHDTPRWSGCTEVVFVADGEQYAIDDAVHELGVSTLGVMEAIQGRIPLAHLEAAAAGEALSVKSCEEQWELASGPAMLLDFVQRFQALRPAQEEEDVSPAATESPNPAIVDSP
ncbi:MAG: hypothetical protein DRJ42_15775 [Deltaproteobacteria bacterium]|nr:MAG: hypothetical protein DRJ42_15775 [Deltaproteobacteria bacterium]